ncbi:molybdenum cofactor biosynthesis protein MoaE [Ectobacillus ponti]|uniref:Molybdopterin synthase catalytic subunit n=1 Tax=Ectobacillus ponti TaxID=2961894 RepID=A0AA41X5G1_9BACI|nr:molybdenum cofactor biosynthesis protein MoaE [Ectobacillus ponti]MCP8967533.1 molybdenum cofactor biosynthesis protein MoaE [Ectobacillus ponti]
MFEIIATPIDTGKVTEHVMHRNAGAVVTFIGTVRELTGEQKTLYLEYESYVPMATAKLEQIGREIAEKWPGTKSAIVHRIGRLEIGDAAVVIAVSSPHRAHAYEANRHAIERIKEMVPIWKKEHWENGEEWIGNQQGTVAYPTGKPEVDQ